MGLDFDLDGIDEEQIGLLLEFLAGTDVMECEIEQAGRRVSVRRRVRDGAEPGESAAPSPVEEVAEDKPLVRASAVGVFRRSDQRSASPPVEVGSRIRSGDLVGYLEVMMVPHGVYSTHGGTIESFLVEDGQPVEYGQPLAAISDQSSAVS